MIQKSNWAILCGSRQNVGKTSLGTLLTQQYKHEGVVAIKISPHLHTPTPGLQILKQSHEYLVARETDISSKDTGRYLAAGATDAFYMQCTDAALHIALENLLPYISDFRPVICESAKIRSLVEPGVFVMLGTEAEYMKKPALLSLLNFEHLQLNTHADYIPNTIRYEKNKWFFHA